MPLEDRHPLSVPGVSCRRPPPPGERSPSVLRRLRLRRVAKMLALLAGGEQAAPLARDELELLEHGAGLRAPPALAAPPLPGEPRAELGVALVRGEDPADDELRRDRPVPAVLLQAEGDVVAADAPEAVELRPEAERDRRAGVAASLADAEAQVPAVPDRAELAQLAVVDEQRHPRVAEPERGEPRQLLAERQAELGAGDDRVDRDARAEVVVGEDGVGVGREDLGERPDPVRLDREPRRGAMAAEAHEMLRAGGERGVQVERARRAAGALRTGDQHDRAAVALDEARGDDPDHPLVPVGAGEDVPAPCPPPRRPGLDLADGRAQDPLLHRLTLAVQR